MPSDEMHELKKKLEEHEKRITELEKIFKSDPKTGKKQISIKEFILSKKPKKDVQKTLVIGYYLEKFEGMSIFNLKDLEEGFRKAKEKVPENINDKVNKNIKKDRIADAKEQKDNKKAWYLTNKGEEFVENVLKKE